MYSKYYFNTLSATGYLFASDPKITDQEKVTKWLDALKSGAYKQATTKIYDYKNDAYCCLGVFGRVNNVLHTDDVHSFLSDDNIGIEFDYLFHFYYKVANSHGEFQPEQYFPYNHQRPFAYMNDVLGLSFQEIVEFIENISVLTVTEEEKVKLCAEIDALGF